MRRRSSWVDRLSSEESAQATQFDRPAMYVLAFVSSWQWAADRDWPSFPRDGGEAMMPTVAVVPVTISPVARAYIERVGQRAEIETMIDRARNVLPGVQLIEVVLDDATEEMPPGVVLWTHRDDIGPANDPTHRKWIAWMAVTFPPDVCQSYTSDGLSRQRMVRPFSTPPVNWRLARARPTGNQVLGGREILWT